MVPVKTLKGWHNALLAWVNGFGIIFKMRLPWCRDARHND
jgi:hypothetical protein